MRHTMSCQISEHVQGLNNSEMLQVIAGQSCYIYKTQSWFLFLIYYQFTVVIRKPFRNITSTYSLSTFYFQSVSLIRLSSGGIEKDQATSLKLAQAIYFRSLGQLGMTTMCYTPLPTALQQTHPPAVAQSGSAHSCVLEEWLWRGG